VQADQADELLLGIRAGSSLTPALYALVGLVQTGRSCEAIAWCDRLLKEDWIDRVPMRRAMIGTIESVAMLSAGDSATAQRSIREVLVAVPPPAWGVVVGLPLSVAIRAAVELGLTDAARSYLAVPVPPAMFDTPFAFPYLLALGSYHAAMGHPESALTHTRSCLELITRWGIGTPEIAAGPAGLEVSPLVPLAEDVQRLFEAGRDESGSDDGAKLTDAEQRVAALAAAGNTNRQIAERLFITVSTVEQHLTKIYRKLNLSSRSGLQRHSC
jgi:DNA-binding CsgD family transcriptional regulator